MIRITLLLALLAPMTLIAQANYEYLGPEGSWINSMVMTADGTLYAEAYPHLFRQRRGEAEWQRIPHYDTLTTSTGAGFVFAALDDVLITMSGCCAMYISFDQGETWQAGPEISSTTDRLGLYHFAESGDSIFMQVPDNSGTLLVSIDSARTWKTIRTLGDLQMIGIGDQGPYVYSYETGLSRLDLDSGPTLIQPEPDGIVRGLASNGDSLVVGVLKRGTTTFTYYRSFDAGTTWEPLTLPEKYGLTIAEGRIWSADSAGIYSATLNAGVSDLTWSLVAVTGINPRSPYPLIVDNDTIHYGTGLGYFRADPGQARVERKSGGMFGFRIERIMVSRDSLIVGTPTDFFITGDHTSKQSTYTMEPRSLPIGTRSEYLVGDDRTLFTSGVHQRNIYRSTDHGRSWDTLQNDITSRFTFHGLYLIGDRLIALPRFSGSFDLLWSNDRGETWDTLKLGNRSVYSAAGSRDTVFLSTSPSSGSVFPVLRSFDGGESWDSTWGPQEYITTANLHFESGSLYYEIPRVGLFRSDDLGDTWRRLQPRAEGSADSLPVAVHDLEISGDTLLLAGILNDQGSREILLYSNNRGSTWIELPSPPSGAYTLALIDDYVYTGTLAHGLFRIRFADILSMPDGNGRITGLNPIAQIGQNHLRVKVTTPNTYQVRLYTIEGRQTRFSFLGHFESGEHRIEIPSITPGHYLAVLTMGSEITGSAMVVIE